MQRFIIGCAIAWALGFMVLPAAGQPPDAPPQTGRTNFSLSAFPLYQFEADLDGGGRSKVDRYSLSLTASRQLNASLKAELGLSYDYEDWDFSGANLFGTAPWGTIHRQSLKTSLIYSGGENWSFYFSPSVQFARESGADWQDSLTYGAVAIATHRFSQRLTLGIGAAAFRDIEETRVFPIATVYWRISDRLYLSNALSTGPAGGAGLQLAYTLNDQLEFALGGAWRSYRFRLDDRSQAAPEGVGQVDLIPLWGRATLNPSSQLGLDLYAGWTFNGTLRLEDKDGDLITEVDQDPAPFGALVFRANF